MIDLRLGDNLEILKTLPDNSVDSLVCDPPYGIKFMNKKWDYDVPSVELWKEVLRVLKPGGHALVACGTRTQHRMAVNLEDAGFEIRDIIAWIYSTGFPKGQNISKGIEAKLKHGKSNSRTLRKVEQEGDGESYVLKGKNNGILGEDRIYERKEFSPDTDEAKYWEGWNTALKPAMELWTLVRKPIEEKTIAENVLKYGTGGINIDECRVEIPNSDQEQYDFNNNGMSRMKKDEGDSLELFEGGWKIDKTPRENNKGRFPANFIHDGSEEVVSLFPNTKSGKMNSNHKRHTDGSPNGIYGKFDVNHPLSETIGDEGSASRFFKQCNYEEGELEEYQNIFYCPKASKKERNEGLKETQNNHPTIKPLALMQYLCRLITPPNGIVLDPYMGSGSTGIAAIREGFNFIGIEREKNYFKIAKERIDAYVRGKENE